MNAHAKTHARPAEGTATARVWELADAISAAKGRRARRGEVVEAYVAEGGNANTGSTQYYYWTQATARKPRHEAAPELLRGPLQLRIAEDGGLVLPPELTAGIELGADRKVTARVVEGELRLITPRVALRKLRATAKALAPEGMAVVDEFIAEKRREAERE
jgi:hypothetical protein